jgi:hypothetical protein
LPRLSINDSTISWSLKLVLLPPELTDNFRESALSWWDSLERFFLLLLWLLLLLITMMFTQLLCLFL